MDDVICTYNVEQRTRGKNRKYNIIEPSDRGFSIMLKKTTCILLNVLPCTYLHQYIILCHLNIIVIR